MHKECTISQQLLMSTGQKKKQSTRNYKTKILVLWVMASVTLLGLQPRVLMEMATGYTIDLEVLNKREVALKSVNMEKNSS